MNLIKTSTLCVLMMAGSAYADNATDAIKSRYDKCYSKSNGVTAHADECNRKAIDEWDKELNTTYKALMQTLNKNQKAKLKHAQRHWIKFRDHEMDFIVASATGRGLIDTLTQGKALVKITEKRVFELKSHLQGSGEVVGDTGSTGDTQDATDLHNMLGWMEAHCGEKVSASDESKHGKMLKAYNAFRANPQASAYASFVSKVEHKQKDTTADGTGTDEKVIYLKNATYRGQPLTKIVNVTEYNSGSETIFFDSSVNWQLATAHFAHTQGTYAVTYNKEKNSISCGSFY